MVERFHRYLNKIQKLHAADCETIDDWLIGMVFAVYGWNAAPIDGTNIIWSFAATGRDFPFPIDIHPGPTARPDNSNFGELAIAHVDSIFPLLLKQREVLQVLLQDRREAHRAKVNDSKHPRRFDVGDIVIVRVQVQTSERTRDV